MGSSKRMKTTEIEYMLFGTCGLLLINQWLSTLPSLDLEPKKYQNAGLHKNSKPKKAKETFDPHQSGGLNDYDASSTYPAFPRTQGPHPQVCLEHAPKELKWDQSWTNNVGTLLFSHCTFLTIIQLVQIQQDNGEDCTVPAPGKSKLKKVWTSTSVSWLHIDLQWICRKLQLVNQSPLTSNRLGQGQMGTLGLEVYLDNSPKTDVGPTSSCLPWLTLSPPHVNLTNTSHVMLQNSSKPYKLPLTGLSPMLIKICAVLNWWADCCSISNPHPS